MSSGVLRAEARRLHTVRSTWWALLAGFAVTVATAAVLGVLLPGHVLSITSEYSTGIIRATLAAVPQRRLYAALALAAGFILITRRDA